MKTTRLLAIPLALVLGVLAFRASGQEEQWLQYLTSTALESYRWIDLSTTPPPNVAWPKVQTPAYYGCWSNGFDGVRWFCLDHSRRGGPCDRLYFDVNGNGRVDDDAPIVSARRDSSMANFDAIKVIFKGEDGPITYHLMARNYEYENQRARLLVSASGTYQGTVTLAGKKRTLRLMDNNANGTFNDCGSNPAESDRMMIGANETRYVGKYLEIDNQLLALEISRDGAYIKVKKAEGVAMGTMRVPDTVSQFQAIGENGHFFRKPAQGAFNLPVGTYRVQAWEVKRTDAKGVNWTLSGSGFSRTAQFIVTADSPVTLNIGEPVRAVLEAREARPQVTFGLQMLGGLGETVQILQGSERARAPRLLITDAKGEYKSTSNFEYG